MEKFGLYYEEDSLKPGKLQVRREHHAMVGLVAFALACGPSRSDPTDTMGMGATSTRQTVEETVHPR
jgi:hypothetical protein